MIRKILIGISAVLVLTCNALASDLSCNFSNSEQQAVKYRNSVAEYNSGVVSDAHGNEHVIRNNSFNCFNRHGGAGDFEARVCMGLSQKFNERYPGSQMNLTNLSGTWVSGNGKSLFQDGQIVTDEADLGAFRYTYTKAANRIRFDDGQNYIVIVYDPKNPENSQITDASLPTMADSAVDRLTQDGAISFKNKAIMKVLNDVYRYVPIANLKTKEAATLQFFAIQLITSQEARNYVIEEAKQFYACQRQTGEQVSSHGNEAAAAAMRSLAR